MAVLTSVAADSLASGIKDVTRRQFKRNATADPLAPDIVGRARTIALEHSKALGLDDQRAQLLADAVSGALTTPAIT